MVRMRAYSAELRLLLALCMAVLVIAGLAYVNLALSDGDSSMQRFFSSSTATTAENGSPLWGSTGSAADLDAHLRRHLAPLLNETRVWTLQQGSLDESRSAIPRIFHQSWKTKQPPKKFEEWRSTCTARYPQWQFQLWDDAENRQLIQAYFPFFLPTFDGFTENILRADASRYAYMYFFGGMYVDLDTECLRSMDTYFQQGKPGVYLSVMDTEDADLHHSVPNAWMASSPGHPFWLLMMANIMQLHQTGGYEKQGIAEDVTGPIALYATLLHYQKMFPDAQDVHLIRNGKIYPFSWSKTTPELSRICNAMFKSFDAEKCKQRFQAEDPFMITYWTHTRRFFKSPILDE